MGNGLTEFRKFLGNAVNSWSDYSCIDPLAPSNQIVNILDKKETLKIAKYSEISQEYIFIPIISTLTTFGKYALSFFKELGSHIRQLTGEPREGYFLRQRLAIAIHKANYISFIGSLIPKDYPS
ncbi:unnamed protein product [Gordionus sp. m RMFG-2023]